MHVAQCQLHSAGKEAPHRAAFVPAVQAYAAAGGREQFASSRHLCADQTKRHDKNDFKTTHQSQLQIAVGILDCLAGVEKPNCPKDRFKSVRQDRLKKNGAVDPAPKPEISPLPNGSTANGRTGVGRGRAETCYPTRGRSDSDCNTTAHGHVTVSPAGRSRGARDAGGRSQDGSNRELAGRTPGKILRAGDACASCGVVYGGAISCGCGDLPALQAFRQPNALPLRKSRYQRYRVYWHLQVRRRKRSQGRSGPSTRFLSVRVS